MVYFESSSFGEMLGQFRVRTRMSQQKLADRLGVHRNTIGAWERGDYLPENRGLVLELTKHLGLNDEETQHLLEAALLHYPTRIWGVPYHRNPLFTGREEELQELHCVLAPGTTEAMTQSRAISGLGGIGKTQTALEYAYRYRDDYSAVLWLQADSRESLSLACVQLVQELGLPEQNETDQARIAAAARRWLKSKTKWLLVLDNVEDLSIVEEFLPPGYRGCVLLTTQSPIVTEYIALVHELGALPEEEGVLLLLRRAGFLAHNAALGLAAPTIYAQAKELWELVEGLPLALDQIGAYMRATGSSLAHYQTLYVDQRRRLDLLKCRGRTPPGHQESVAGTFSLAFEKIQTLNPAAADLLRVCALLHPKAIPEEIVTKGGDQLGSQLSSLAADPLLLDQAVDALQTYSLVHRDAQESTFSMHRLVQAILQDTMQTSEQEEWAKRLVRAVNQAFMRIDMILWKQLQRQLPQVQACAALIDQHRLVSLDAADLLTRAGYYVIEGGVYDQGERLLQQAISIYESLLGAAHPYTASALNNLAGLYLSQGKYDKAETLLQQAMVIEESIPDPEHPRIANSLNNLAECYRIQGRYEEAETLLRRALAIREQVSGNQSSDYSRILDNLAKIYQVKGDFAQAEQIFKRALEFSEQVLGPIDPTTATNLNNLSMLYCDQGKYEEAEPLLRRALAIREEVLGSSHPQTMISFQNLLDLCYVRGQHEQVETLLQQALVIYEKVLGSEHLETASVLIDLALLYDAQGRKAQASALFLRALSIREKVFGADYPSRIIAVKYYTALLPREIK
jgi:tetratricopeptide (TPR) repeat protein/transcriptional regulator with XRE-family HTH domain